MKRISNLFILILILGIVAGCGDTKEKINSDSKLAKAKNIMINDLDNFSYTIKITTQMGIMDATTTMNCKEDRQNKTGYCLTSAYGAKTEEYYDFNKGVSYTKVSSSYSNDSQWITNSINNVNTNSWLSLNDYIFNISEEKQGSSTLYKGVISSQKLASAMAQTDTNVDVNKIVNSDINVSILVNASNYIEKVNFEMEIMGMNEIVEITYNGFDTTGSTTIPKDVRK